jgi:Leucine-rich repeat (LRR) protein
MKSPIKYKLAAVILILLITPVLIFMLLSQQQKPDPVSEIAIRAVVSQRLHKEPNEITDEDFAKISALYLHSITDANEARKIWDRTKRSNNVQDQNPDPDIAYIRKNVKLGDTLQMIADLNCLDKFANLKELELWDFPFPDYIPKWKDLLIKLHILNPYKALDLSPLKKLKKLKTLHIYDSNIKSVEPLVEIKSLEMLSFAATPIPKARQLSKLQNIKTLSIVDTEFRELKTLMKLKRLKHLILSNTKLSDLKPLKKLNNLEDLSINNEPIDNLEVINEIASLKELTLSEINLKDLTVIKELKNLQVLYLQSVPINNLDLIIQLPNIKQVYYCDCYNIKAEQWKVLKKALPNVIIREEGVIFSPLR